MYVRSQGSAVLRDPRHSRGGGRPSGPFADMPPRQHDQVFANLEKRCSDNPRWSLRSVSTDRGPFRFERFQAHHQRSDHSDRRRSARAGIDRGHRMRRSAIASTSGSLTACDASRARCECRSQQPAFWHEPDAVRGPHCMKMRDGAVFSGRRLPTNRRHSAAFVLPRDKLKTRRRQVVAFVGRSTGRSQPISSTSPASH